MEQHVKMVGILHIVLGSLGVLGALVVLMIFGGLAGLAGVSDHEGLGATAVPILGAIGLFCCGVVLILSLPGLIGGIGLVKMAPWSRMFMIVISALDLIHIPLGTALGIYGLWALTKPETAALFERRRYQPGY
ncbi:MAG TPA: hypothetical protein VE959_00995 [Bryobacteraceae bacterium]|nr:hypothetical protein [Bryobacteraceae bacterium]